MVSSVIILGTSRRQGNTEALAQEVKEHLNAELFSLSDFDISPYDYQHRNRDDDFLTLVRQLLTFEHLIFATPVYWYSVSSQMKILIDRLSDLLTIERELGRQLRNKTASIVATGNDLQPPQCFEDALTRTFSYLGINYLEMLYCDCEDSIVLTHHTDRIMSFIRNIKEFREAR